MCAKNVEIKYRTLSGTKIKEDTLPGKKGSRIIYVPSINNISYLHFSWENDCFTVRDFSRSLSFKQEDLTIDGKTLNPQELWEMKIREALPTDRPVTDKEYWVEKIKELNINLPKFLL